MNALRRGIAIRELRAFRVLRVAHASDQSLVERWIDSVRRAGEQ